MWTLFFSTFEIIKTKIGRTIGANLFEQLTPLQLLHQLIINNESYREFKD